MDIKEITLKAVRRARDHDNCAILSGNIYLHNKLVGEFAEDYWSGPMLINISSEYQAEVEGLAKEFFETHPFGIYKPIQDCVGQCNMLSLYKGEYTEGIITELCSLHFMENAYKRLAKEGFSYVWWYLRSKNLAHSDYVAFQTEEEFLLKKPDNVLFKVTCLEDFSIQ